MCVVSAFPFLGGRLLGVSRKRESWRWRASWDSAAIDNGVIVAQRSRRVKPQTRVAPRCRVRRQQRGSDWISGGILAAGQAAFNAVYATWVPSHAYGWLGIKTPFAGAARLRSGNNRSGRKLMQAHSCQSTPEFVSNGMCGSRHSRPSAADAAALARCARDTTDQRELVGLASAPTAPTDSAAYCPRLRCAG